MLNYYKLRSLGILLSCPRKYELLSTIKEIKNSINLAKELNKSIGLIEFNHLPRKRWRVTYLKSRFKHRKAIRHYVFEQYNYKLNIYEPDDITSIIGILLGSLSPSVHLRCTFNWKYNNNNDNTNYKKKII